VSLAAPPGHVVHLFLAFAVEVDALVAVRG
jgi:hypothetical protein